MKRTKNGNSKVTNHVLLIFTQIGVDPVKCDVFKINTEVEQELAGTFGIQSIPSILFIPMDGQPQMTMGALPKDTLIKAINEVLKIELVNP